VNKINFCGERMEKHIDRIREEMSHNRSFLKMLINLFFLVVARSFDYIRHLTFFSPLNPPPPLLPFLSSLPPFLPPPAQNTS